MDRSNSVVTDFFSWFTLQWQKSPFCISFVVAVVTAICCIAVILMRKKQTKDKKGNVHNAVDPNFRVLEEIMETDSKSIIV